MTGLSRRGQAMLAFLACQPGLRAERARLADLLWSDRAEGQARASLRQELATLKKALPPGLLSADRQAVWLDASRIAALQDGSADFLEGFDLPSEGFEDWLRGRRAEAVESAGEPVPARPARGGRPSLAVMPFEELGAAAADMFPDGVVEEITGALSRMREVEVIARQSAFALKGRALSAPEIAGRLGADYLLEGSVRRSGERVRIAVQLVRGADGHAIWSERFDDRLDDLFDLQDRVAAQVAGQLSPSLRSAEIARARTTPPNDRTAYELVLTALPHFWAHQAKENHRALELLDLALARDPDYAPARAYKAWCHAQQCCYIWSDDPAAERKLAAAERAAATAGDHAPTLVAISAALSLTTLERARAQSYIDRALALDPNNAWGWLRNGWLASLNNLPVPAMAHFDRAEALSPLDPFLFNVKFGRANVLAEEGRYEEAIAFVEAGLNLAPGVTWAYRMLASYYGSLGDTARGREALDAFLCHYPGMTIEKMRASMPPSVFATQPHYIEGLRRVGIPEK